MKTCTLSTLASEDDHFSSVIYFSRLRICYVENDDDKLNMYTYICYKIF